MMTKYKQFIEDEVACTVEEVNLNKLKKISLGNDPNDIFIVLYLSLNFYYDF